MAYAKWIGENIYAGPINNKRTLILKGEIRKILLKQDGMYILEGRNLGSQLGWVSPVEIQVAETKEELEK